MQPIFGIVINGEVYLNKFGKIARNCLKQIQSHFANIDLDEYVVMPNHVHGIVVIRETTVEGATHASPLQEKPGPPVGSLGAIIGSYKSAVTRRINQIRGTLGGRVWQRNYYERIIRDERGLNRVRSYIRHNLIRWNNDRNRTW